MTDAIIQLSNGMGEAIIDSDDLRLVERGSWWGVEAPNTTYAQGSLDGRTVLLHRVIMSAPTGVRIDHRDRDGLNCRRGNMRFCTSAQNQQNSRAQDGTTAPYKGVCLHKQSGRYRAYIKDRGVQKSLGYHDTARAAALAYDEAAVSLFGEFSLTNRELGLL